MSRSTVLALPMLLAAAALTLVAMIGTLAPRSQIGNDGATASRSYTPGAFQVVVDGE